jgi:hypothetical protein
MKTYPVNEELMNEIIGVLTCNWECGNCWYTNDSLLELLEKLEEFKQSYDEGDTE